MITPGLIRRSLLRAAQWRLLLFTPLVLLIPAAVAFVPLRRLLGELLDHTPRWKELTAHLDGLALGTLLRELQSPAGLVTVPSAIQGAALVALVLLPLAAGAALAAARSDDTLDLRELLQGAAEHYGRLFRVQLVGTIPLGIAGGIATGVSFWAGKKGDAALTEAVARSSGRAAIAVAVVVFLVANLALDAARGWFAAQPTRRSAFFALGAGVSLVVRRPLRALSIGLVTWTLSLLLAVALWVLRQQIPQASGAAVLLAWLVAQAAVAAVGWGHAARLIGFAELARADAASRARRQAFEMAPPRTSPPPPPLAAAPPAPAAPVQPAEQQVAPLAEPFPSPGLQAVVAAEAAELAAADAEAQGPAPTSALESAPRVEEAVALGPVGFAPDPGGQAAGGAGTGPAGEG